MLIHEKEIIITSKFLDENQHVNNVQYVHWVEMMAAEHWEILKDYSPYPKDVWFLSDHFIQYKKQVFLGDKLLMRTYPLDPEGIRQPRKVEFYKDGELVVDSLTHWVLIHPDTGRIKRIEENWIKELEEEFLKS